MITLLFVISFSLMVHLTVGGGSPLISATIFSVCPEGITFFIRFLRSIYGARNLGLATTEFDTSLWGEGPALFIATTLNSYSCPSITSCTLPVFLSPGTVRTSTQFLSSLSLICTTYF
uniref:Putative secreted protein n=1 Tax=Panstrongylus lignarius TaxID=156445 RepID=A0A224Y1H5_9HEMI